MKRRIGVVLRSLIVSNWSSVTKIIIGASRYRCTSAPVAHVIRRSRRLAFGRSSLPEWRKQLGGQFKFFYLKQKAAPPDGCLTADIAASRAQSLLGTHEKRR